MNPEDFLRNQIRTKLNSNRRFYRKSETFKRQIEEYGVTLWKQIYHRGDEAVRQAMSYASRSTTKKRG